MELKNLASTVIESSHGWAVAEQFEQTFDSQEHFAYQNMNALRLINETVSGLLRSRLLSDEAFEELSRYSKNLYEHINFREKD